MEHRIRRAFDDIRADEALIQHTLAFLEAERAGHGKRRPAPRALRLAGAMAAVLALVAGLFGYQTFYATAVAYVGIDVNPSVELALNRMDTVIAVTAFNPEGEAVIAAGDVKGRRYDDAVASVLGVMEREGYLSGGSLVSMTVQAMDGEREQALCDALRLSAVGQVGGEQAHADVEVFTVTPEVRESAQGCHMSAAKYLAIQELMEVDETATLEDYSDASIGQIRQRTQACRDGHGGGSGDSSTGNRWGGGHGNGHHGGG